MAMAEATDCLLFRRRPHLLLLLCLAVAFGLGQEDNFRFEVDVGESVIFNCQVYYPQGRPTPFVVQWIKEGLDVPVFIWYENYPTHIGEGFEGRASRVTDDPDYGTASLNLTNIRPSDQGSYQCQVTFLNRASEPDQNGTWFHLVVRRDPNEVTSSTTSASKSSAPGKKSTNNEVEIPMTSTSAPTASSSSPWKVKPGSPSGFSVRLSFVSFGMDDLAASTLFRRLEGMLKQVDTQLQKNENTPKTSSFQLLTDRLPE